MPTSVPAPPSSTEVIDFWRTAGPSRWFRQDEAFDNEFRQRFEAAHEAAAQGELDGWADSPEGALALLILLDQFPRNAYRHTARMFATDTRALQLAEAALAAGFDQRVEPALRNFFYLPFMHSERPADQDKAVALTRPLGEDALKFALIHRDIILRFGRFPHRNALLARRTTEDEQAFLDNGGFAG